MTASRSEKAAWNWAVRFLVCTTLVSPAAGAGSIAGLVRTEDGIPLAGAIVSYTRIPRFTKGSKPGSLVLAPGEIEFVSKVGSNADGSFQAANVPAGQYLLCVQPPTAAFLDPCKWTGGTLVTVPEGGAATGKEIWARKAAQMVVRIEDPAGLIPAAVSIAELTVGAVTGSGAFHALNLASRDSTGRSLTLPVPPDTPLKLRAHAAGVYLTDANGTPIDRPGDGIPFVAASAAPSNISLKVAGPKLRQPTPPVAPRAEVTPPAPVGPFPPTPRQGGKVFRQPPPPAP